jgi:lipoprotein-anchoring transpeptidase ErfK/SrfK
MRRDHRKQPWQTFPFWFLMLSGLTLTVAWKLDLLKPKAPVASLEESSEPVEEQAPDWASETAEPEEEMAAVEGQSEPVVEDDTARSFPAEAIAAEIPEDTGSAEVAEAPPAPAPDETAEPQSHNPFSRSQVRITPVSGSRTIPSVKAEPEAESEPGSRRNPFGPSTTVIKGTRTRFGTQETAAPANFGAKTAPQAPAAEEVRTAENDVAAEGAPAEFPAAGETAAPSQNAKASLPAKSTESVDFTTIDQLIEDGEDVEANFQLSNLYWKQPESRPQLIQRLRAVAYRIYFAPQPHYMEGHVVQPGDVLQNIAKDNDVSWEYLAKLNRTDAKKIRPGQKLKVIKGPFAAVVDLSDMELTIHSHGHFVALFPVGIGKDIASPVGNFKVADKLRDPTYYGAEGVIEHDDPKNPLGEYLIDLGEGVGIHGTSDQGSIGQAGSLGCVRMKDRDIADAFDLLTIGSEVLIKK